MLLALLLALACRSSAPDPEAVQEQVLAASAPTVLARADVATAPGVAPVGPGDLTPFEGDLGEGVQVLAVGPVGEQLAPVQAVVVFDRPMVALAELDRAAPPPLSCGPDVSGQARWAGTTTAVFVPEGGRFPKASALRCEVPAGLAAADGATLAAPLVFSFATPGPRVKRVLPYAHRPVGPEGELLLTFDQAVEPEAVQEAASIVGPDGRAVALRARRATAEDGERLGARMPRDLDRAVIIRADLARDTDYTLRLAAGLRGREGHRGMAEPHEHGFSTIPPAGILKAFPTGEGVNPYTALRLELATETEGEQLNPRVSIEPAPPDGWAPPQDYRSTSWWYSLRLEPMTTYTVTVEAGAEDVYGQGFASGRRWTFTTGHLSALLDAPSGARLYPANNPPALPLRSRNLARVFGAVQRLDAEEARKLLSKDGTFSSWTPPAIPGGQTVHEASGGPDDRVHLHELDLAPHLVEGRGLLLVELWSPDLVNQPGRPVVYRSLLQVTDLGTTFKLDGETATVWVTRLSDGQPVEGARVQIFRDGILRLEGETGPGGVLHSPLKLREYSQYRDTVVAVVEHGEDRALTLAGSPHELSTWGFGVYTSAVGQPASLLVHGFADRGVYKPGETARVALSARVADAGGLGLPEGARATWGCRDGRYQEFLKGELALDRDGLGHFDVPIPPDVALGDAHCTIEVKAEGLEPEITHVGVPVFAYRSPSFRVDVSAPEDLTAGATLKATGHGRYLFGAAMTGAEARWSVRSRVVDPALPGWEGWTFGDRGGRPWWEAPHAAVEQVAEGEGALDAEGALAVTLEVPVTEQARPRELEVEVTVTDAARQRISNRGVVRVHPADHYVGLKPTTAIGRAGQPVGAELVVVDPEGQPLRGVPVELRVSRRTWDVVRQKGVDGRWTWVSTTQDEVVDTRTVASGAGAEVQRFTPEVGGYYVFRAESRDAAGRLAVSEEGLYVAGPGASWARGDDQRVELVPDRRSYAPGDVARVLVKAPKAGLSALVTVEREGVLSQRVLQLATASETIDVALGEEAAPNVFLSVLLVDGAPPSISPDGGVPQTWMGLQELRVDPSGRRLDVSVSTDRQVYQPGEEVVVDVEVRRGGRPAAGARVVLWAVDYGVLSLTGYTLPDPFERFYERRDLRVLTNDNRTRVLNRADYLSKGAEAGGGGGSAGPGLRANFVTTPFWAPDLVADDQGRVQARFTLPDNLTTFKLMAVVHEDADAFGGASQELRVSRPLIARPALPRVLRTGDRAAAGIVVHNNRDEARTVAVTAEASGLTLEGSPLRVEVPAQGAVEVPFSLSQPQVGEARLRFEVEAGPDRDGVEVRVPVLRPQPSEVVATAGSFAPGEEGGREALSALEGALPGVGGLELDVSSTVLVGADASLGYLVAYPHGCLEQTTSRLLALLVARELGPRAGAGLDLAQVDALLTEGFAKVGTFSHPSGGLAYWPGGREPSALATAHAVEVLHRGGQPLSKDTLRFLREVLADQWLPVYATAEQRQAIQARVALALARVGQGDAGFNARLWGRRGPMSLVARAELAEAIARTTGPDARTAGLLQDVLGAARVEATRATLVEPEQGRHAALWWGEGLLTSAGIAALMQADPDHALLPRLARGLVLSRSQGRWSNTYVTARAFAALGDYVARYEAELAREVRATLAGEALIEGRFEGSPSLKVRVPLEDYAGGELAIQGDGRIYYEARLRYARESMPPRDEGFTLTRRFELIEGGGAGGSVTPGALVRVHVQVSTPVTRYAVAVVDPLPAGLEAVDTFFATTASALGGEEAEDSGWRPVDTGVEVEGARAWSDWVFDHRELRDDGVYLYAGVMPPGVHTYTYYARATTPGDYAHPASTVEEMYAPEIFGRTEAGRFVVGAGPVAGR